jgi:hypothetical protein
MKETFPNCLQYSNRGPDTLSLKYLLTFTTLTIFTIFPVRNLETFYMCVHRILIFRHSFPG